MDKLAVNGDNIVLQAVGFLWQGWDGKLPLKGSNVITSEGKSVILEKDVMTAALQGVGKMYVAPPFATPGSVVNLQLTVVPVTLSLSASIQGMAVVTAATMGTYTASVVPAMNPQGVPDPLITKVGQWTVETTSQGSFRSGMPAAVPPEDPGDGSGDGESQESEGKDHWVGVSIEDTDGNPLANQIASLELPGGQTLPRVLGDSGATRVDGIVLDEEKPERTCTVRLFFDPKRAPVRPKPDGFIAVQLVDEAGEPLAGREVTLTLPDGTELRRTLDDLGRARFTPIPEGAQCKLEIVAAQVVLEFTLVDEDGTPLAGKAFTVKDSTGVEITGVLDEDGFASVLVAEGECDVKVDFDAASADDETAAGDPASTDTADEAVEAGADLDATPTEIAFTLALFPNLPQAGRPFQISGPGTSIAGEAGGDGRVQVTVNGQQATLLLEANETTPSEVTYKLKLGSLGPVTDETAFFERLKNLGYYREVFPEEDEIERKMAIEEFQCDHALVVDGVKGPKTESKLREVHGS